VAAAKTHTEAQEANPPGTAHLLVVHAGDLRGFVHAAMGFGGGYSLTIVRKTVHISPTGWESYSARVASYYSGHAFSYSSEMDLATSTWSASGAQD
jgi:hypothetical protein